PADNFVAHSVLGVAGNVSAAAIALLFASFLGHRLGQADYGVVVALLSVGYILSLILSPVESGVSQLASHFFASDQPGGLRTLAFGGLRRSLLPCLGLFLLWWPLCYPLRAWLQLPDIYVLLWLGALWILSLPQAIVRGVMRGAHRFFDYSLSQV